MNRHSTSFRAAFVSLMLAIGLPLLVFLAANVRQRQLQSKANPRWAEFAKATASRDASTSTPPAQPATLAKPAGSSGVSAQLASHKGLTGSAAGSSPVEMPIAPANPAPAQLDRARATAGLNRPEQTVELPMPANSTARVPLPDDERFPQASGRLVDSKPHVTFRAVEDGSDETAATSKRLETRLAGMQQRLDQLAQAQFDKQVSDLERATKLLQQLEQTRPNPLEQVKQNPLLRDLAGPLLDSLPSPSPSPTPPPALSPTPSSKTTVEPTPGPSLPAPAAPTSSPKHEGTIKIIQRDEKDDEKFSLQVHDAELTNVLDMLGQLSGVNILSSAEVQGRVSLNLQDVTVDRALEAILKSRGFVYERDDDFIYVKTAAEVAALKTLNRKLVTKVYQPNYISAGELSKLVSPIMTKTVGQFSVTTPAQVGIAKTPENAGGDGLAQRDALLVQDYPEVLAEIDKVVIEMDVPPLQVIIEAKILNVILSDSMEFGVNFAMLNGSHKQLTVSGNGATLNGSTGFPDTADLSPPLGDFVANTAGLKYGFITGDVTGFIKALENIADTSLVAAPQIRVLNKQKAEMIIGDRLSYKTLAFNGTQTVENVQFLDAGTKLLFRPFISSDGMVRMEVHPERSSATINKETGLPNQSTTEVTTNIMVRDGTTVVIGGLIAEETTESIDRVPVLGAVPLIGAAFRNKTEKTLRNELIVLITPRIVTEPEAAMEGECLRAETENRAAHFRDNLSATNRQNMTRGHYERAQTYFEQGNLIKARQQIDAALYQNKNDLDSLRLKAQIEQATRDQHARMWKWPLGSSRGDRSVRR